MPSYEIEIKCLLGEEGLANELVSKMKGLDPGLVFLGSEKQKNHYFIDGRLSLLAARVKPFLAGADFARLLDVAEKSADYSVRTRENDKGIFLVVKASVDDTTSANGIARLELELPTKNLTLDELDGLILEAGFRYQAKWSRERNSYKFLDASVSIDKNAGYGYLTEFETLIDDINKTEAAKESLRRLIRELGLAELEQSRLERMFAYYNEHWPEYYGTDKIFVIE
jgi:predicted adenylyl cyclase CyaB